MSSVNGASNNATNATQQNSSSAVSNYSSQMGKTEFLELLVAQLKNQDPLDPVNNDQFVTQLASFSSLEQLMSINEGVGKLVDGSKESDDSQT